jgi:hypothetical protein
MIFVYIIILFFLLFSAKYFFKNSLSSSIQRNQTLIAVIKCIYFLPVFFIAAYLLYASIIDFYFLVLNFSELSTSTAFHFPHLFIICYFYTIAICVGFLYWLAKKNAK